MLSLGLGRSASVALLAGLMMIAPARAGQVTLRVEPHGETAEAVRSGFQLYSLFRSFKKNRAKVDQRGSSNGAAIAQHGSGNWAEIFQRGSGHSGQITQNGNNNSYGIFQFGRRTSVSRSQTGNGNTGFEIIGGW